MRTNTAEKIYKFIQEQGQTTPKKIIDFIGFSAPAVFRQLKKLQERELIQKSGVPPRVLYHLPMTPKERLIQETILWVINIQAEIINNKDFYCPTRDVFQFRTERILKALLDSGLDESLSYLLVAVIGEIGNNSYDHNLGNWPDIPGVFFKVDLPERLIMLADRGQGVLTTLKKIRPNIADDTEALRTAFTEIISGRSPEHRGNGLKFVRRVIEENKLTLTFYSGQGKCLIENGGIKFLKAEKNVKGTAAIIEF
ncbi:MAG: winged helix-turn-helix domain-containing protein [Patescibacteria group bacterium]